MYSLCIVGIVVVILFVVVGELSYEDRYLYTGLFVAGAIISIACWGRGYSFDNERLGYAEVSGYSYVKNDVIVFVDDVLYEKDGVYYKQEGGESDWIPFADCEYVEVSVEGIEDIDARYCPKCSRECSTLYCGYCGTRVVQ